MAANQLRIIGGRHRGRRLQFNPGRGLRPTPDRVRETLFNWLQRDIQGARCLDLFAGSGALGLEALSRGAAEVVFVERQRTAAEQIRRHLDLLGETSRGTVRRQDALRLLQDAPEQRFDIVFVDPPFADRLCGTVIMSLSDRGWLADPSVVDAIIKAAGES